MNAIKKSLFSILILVGSLFLAKGASAYTVENNISFDINANSGTSGLHSYTVPNVSDRWLVCISSWAQPAMTGLTYNNLAFTQLNYTPYYQFRLYGLKNPTVGTYNIVANWSSTWRASNFRCFTLTGVGDLGASRVYNNCTENPFNTYIFPQEQGSLLLNFFTSQSIDPKVNSYSPTTNSIISNEVYSTRLRDISWNNSSVANQQQTLRFNLSSANGCMESFIQEFKSATLQLAITTPQNNASIYQNQNTTLSGVCPVNGSNRLAVQMTNAPHNLPSLNYNIACSNNQFSTVIQDPYTGQGPIYVYDTAYQTNADSKYVSMITVNSSPMPLSISEPANHSDHIIDTELTVSGTCQTNGANQLAITSDCSSFANLNFNIACSNGAFTTKYFYNGQSRFIAIVDKASVATDCVDYDDLMTFNEINGIQAIEGYPDDWYFNYSYYDDYDIKINSPKFDMPSLTIPITDNSVDMSFKFIYPMPLSPNLVFTIKQYDKDGNSLNESYHSKALYLMTDTNNYTVNLVASSSAIHYVVQLVDNGNLKRQYPFGVFRSSFDYVINPDSKYLFPRLVESLKKKVIFNYYFSFYDGFYTLFNNSSSTPASDALDVSFKSVSANKQYNIDIPIFKGSDPQVKDFADKIRPYAVSFLWVAFALYVVLRISRLWNSNNE